MWKFIRCAIEQNCNKQTGANEQSGEDIKSRYSSRKRNHTKEVTTPLCWKVNVCCFPKLASFVHTVLCIPDTSVPCGRLFSTSGYIVNKLRASLTRAS